VSKKDAISENDAIFADGAISENDAIFADGAIFNDRAESKDGRGGLRVDFGVAFWSCPGLGLQRRF
jgi:hypothetical protein